MEFIDSHAHVYLPQFENDLEEIIRISREAGVTKIFMPNVDLETVDAMFDTESRFSGYCIPMIGLHPCSVTGQYPIVLDAVYQWLQKRPFAAIGEIGLDMYWDKTYHMEQIQVLNRQLDWAIEFGLPVVIHCRETMRETLELVERRADGRLKGVFHCFIGTVSEARRVVDAGFYIGIGGVATFKNGKLERVLEEIKLNRLLLETDSPYLSPEPFRGKRNDPSKLPYIAAKIAQVKNITIEEVAARTTKNSLNLFNSWD